MYYGVREHGMAAAMNGMALHGGVIPYSGTFLIFSDYLRPSLRLAALMGVRAIHVLTHDSIGLGEDGPTHQPVEHMAALRAIPNLHVFRPADAVEVAECWQLALEKKDGPSVLALTRQGVPTLRTDHSNENLSAKGGYVLAEADGDRAATILATGSEVEVAMAARAALQADGVPTAVVSMPCWELFAAQGRRLARLGAGRWRPGRGRGRGRHGLGTVDRARRRLCRHDGFRRLGAGRHALRKIRHHGGRRRRCGQGTSLNRPVSATHTMKRKQ